jgi:DNA invertase Pin-like site-specific DNA recombinase
MQVHAYLRWSDQHQSKGSSLSRQTKDIEAFAAALGWPVVENIVENGVSAFSGANLDRGELGKLERRIRAGEFVDHCLMVERVDRLTRRNSFDAMRWFGDMVEAGATIAIADVKMVVDAASIRNQRQQLKALLDDFDKANAYSEVLGSRVRAAWQTMRDGKEILAERDGTVSRLTVVGARKDVTRIEVSRGRKTNTYWVNQLDGQVAVKRQVSDGQALGVLRQKTHAESTCPAWLELIENRTTFNIRPDIVAVIERIFRLYVETDLGARGIAKVLNGEGVPVFRDGRCWHGSTIKVLLQNRALIGEYEHKVKRQPNGVVVADYFPQVISTELFQAANDQRHTRIKSNHSRTSRLRHLFSEIGRCFECDAKLTYVTKRTVEVNGQVRFDSYAVCQSAYLNTGCKQKKSLRMMPVEDTVLNKLLELALDDEHFMDEDSLPELRREIADKKRIVEDCQRRINALLDLIADASFARDDRFDMRLRTAQNEEKAAKEALKAATSRLVTAQGVVTPQEHVRRVSEIRADLWSADEAKGFDARRKVKMAINDLCDRFWLSPAHRQAVLVLKGSVRKLVVDWNGRLVIDASIWREQPAPTDSAPVRAYFERLAKTKTA